MKSVIQEASSLTKAIEQGWAKAGKPKEFSVKIFEEPIKNFFGFTSKPAKVGIFFKDDQQSGSQGGHRSMGDDRARRNRRPSGQHRQQASQSSTVSHDARRDVHKVESSQQSRQSHNQFQAQPHIRSENRQESLRPEGQTRSRYRRRPRKPQDQTQLNVDSARNSMHEDRRNNNDRVSVKRVSGNIEHTDDR
jgi:predicted RNA-binding protein Jag